MNITVRGNWAVGYKFQKMKNREYKIVEIEIKGYKFVENGNFGVKFVECGNVPPPPYPH